MYIYKAKFTDFLNNVREEEFRFNLTESELIDMDLTTSGGIRQLLEKMVEAQDVPELIRFFKQFIKASYGVISPDGRNFDKGEDIWRRFASTNAYSDLYMKLVQDSDFALEFINGVIPTANPKEAPNNQNIMAIEQAKEKVLQTRGSNN